MGRMTRMLFGIATVAAIFSPAAGTADEGLDRAISLAAEERYQEAREVLDPVLERSPDDPQARLLDGVLHAREGKVRDARDVFDRLRRDRPEMSEPWNNLAVLYAAEGRFDEAREALLAALRRKPLAATYANLGDVYTSLARRAYRQARSFGSGGTGAGPGSGEETGTVLSLPEVPGASSPTASSKGQAAEPGRSSARAPGTASGAAAVPAVSCVRAAGFEDRRVVDAVAEWLQSRGAEAVEVHRVEHRTIRNHQVYLPAFSDRATATAKVREIRARGVRDVAVIGRGSLANGVSFGVFRSPENMRRRVAALERLGYPVRKKDNMKTVHRYALEARTGSDPAALRAAWSKRFPEHSIDLVDCG